MKNKSRRSKDHVVCSKMPLGKTRELKKKKKKNKKYIYKDVTQLPNDEDGKYLTLYIYYIFPVTHLHEIGLFNSHSQYHTIYGHDGRPLNN